MGQIKVRPTPCLIIPSDTTIEDTIRLMQENKKSYVVIKDAAGFLAGIFTDRDLLTQFFALSEEKNRARPISTVASRPLKTLSVDAIHTVGDFMLKNNVRHVPIIESGHGKEPDILLGLVTSHSIFKSYIRLHGSPDLYEKDKASKVRTIGVLSGNGTLYFKLVSLFKNSPHYRIERLYFSNLQKEVDVRAASERLDAILVDMDESPKREWLHLLTIFNATPNVELVALTFQPENHGEEVLNLMKQLKSTGQFLIYEKPMDFSSILLDLQESWQD